MPRLPFFAYPSLPPISCSEGLVAVNFWKNFRAKSVERPEPNEQQPMRKEKLFAVKLFRKLRDGWQPCRMRMMAVISPRDEALDLDEMAICNLWMIGLPVSSSFENSAFSGKEPGKRSLLRNLVTIL
jgi:hypothetical protein